MTTYVSVLDAGAVTRYHRSRQAGTTGDPFVPLFDIEEIDTVLGDDVLVVSDSVVFHVGTDAGALSTTPPAGCMRCQIQPNDNAVRIRSAALGNPSDASFLGDKINVGVIFDWTAAATDIKLIAVGGPAHVYIKYLGKP